MTPGLLPLFPLQAVLFPGMALPLHIFEPRYKQMIHDCGEESSPFGVVLAADDGIATVGCTAEVVRVVKSYPDGRLDLLTEGRRRFRVIDTNSALPYLRAEVEWLADPLEDVTALRDRVLTLYRSTYWAHAQGLPPSSLAEAPVMSFVAARSQLLDLGDRQRLLEMETESARLEALVEALGELEPQVRRLGGNGHGLPIKS